MTDADDDTVTSFSSSRIFVTIYACTCCWTVIVMMIVGYTLMSDTKLSDKSFEALDLIKQRLGYIDVAVDTLFRKKDNKLVTKSNMKTIVNDEYSQIVELLNKHRQQTLAKIDTNTTNSNPNEHNNPNSNPATALADYVQHSADITLQVEDVDDKKDAANVNKEEAEMKENVTVDGLAIGAPVEAVTLSDEVNIKLAGNSKESQVEVELTELTELRKIISKQMNKYSFSTNKGKFKFLKILWDLKGLLLSGVAHFFDTATDIGLIIEWYYLWQRQEEKHVGYTYLENIDMFVFFILAFVVLIYYRIVSTYYVWQFTRSKLDSILQFVFDFYLIKLIYYNLAKMRSHKKLELVKIMRGIEGSNESAFQSVLTLTFLLKTNFVGFNTGDDDNNYNIDSGGTLAIAVLSLIFSFYSLVNRFIDLDYYALQPIARDIGNIQLKHVLYLFKCKCGKFYKNVLTKIHFAFLFHYVLRIIEVFNGILFVSSVWTIAGGIWVALIAFLTFLWGVAISYNFTTVLLTACKVKNCSKIDNIPIDWFRYLLVGSMVINSTTEATNGFICGANLIIVSGFRVFAAFMSWFIYSQLLGEFEIYLFISFVLYGIVIGLHIIGMKWYSMAALYIKKNLDTQANRYVDTYTVDGQGVLLKEIDEYYNNDASNELQLNISSFIATNNKQCLKFCSYLISDDNIFSKQIKDHFFDNDALVTKHYLLILDLLLASLKTQNNDNNLNNNNNNNNDEYNYDGTDKMVEMYLFCRQWYNYSENDSFVSDAFDNRLKSILQIDTLLYIMQNRLINNFDLYKKLHKVGLSLESDENNKYYDMNILHWACMQSRIDIVKWIFENDVIKNVNQLTKAKHQADFDGWTCLHFLMRTMNASQAKTVEDFEKFGAKQIFQLLMDNGIDQNVVTSGRYWPGLTAKDIIGNNVYDQLLNAVKFQE